MTRDKSTVRSDTSSTQFATATNINVAGEPMQNSQDPSANLQCLINQQQLNMLITDKRLLELRVVALEYVKQIVAKASELSQERQKIKDAQKLTNYYNGSSTNYNGAKTNAHTKLNATTTSTKRLPEPIDPTKEREVLKEAAISINKRFQLVDGSRFVGEKNEKYRDRTTASAGYGTDRHQDRTSDTENNFNLTDRHGNNSSSGVGSTPTKRATNSSRHRSGLHQRLNWHLLVSCFSTCLPQSLVEATSRSATTTSSHGGMGAHRGAGPTSGV